MHKTPPPPNPDAIARQAYFIWEREGRPSGRDLEFWARAEHELRAADLLTDELPPSPKPAPASTGRARRILDAPSPSQPAPPAKPRSRNDRNRPRPTAAL